MADGANLFAHLRDFYRNLKFNFVAAIKFPQLKASGIDFSYSVKPAPKTCSK